MHGRGQGLVDGEEADFNGFLERRRGHNVVIGISSACAETLLGCLVYLDTHYYYKISSPPFTPPQSSPAPSAPPTP